MSPTQRRILLLFGIASALVFVFFAFTVQIIGFDGWIHLNWLDEFTSLVRQGEWRPRWLPHVFSGFGSPAFYFYSPLVYYLAAIISFTGIHSAVCLYYVLAFASIGFSYCFMLKYLKGIGIESNRRLYSFLYAVNPYVLINFYIRNALAELVAFALLPLVLLAIHRLITTQDDILGSILKLTCLFALLLLLHLPTAIICAVAAFLYILSILGKQNVVRPLSVLFASSLWAGLIAAFFLIPAAELLPAIHGERLTYFISGGRAALFGIDQLLAHQTGTYVYAQILLLLLGFIGIIASCKYWNNNRYEISHPVFILLLASVILQIPSLSAMLYLIPIFNFNRIAHRWDGVLMVGIAVLISNLTLLSKSRPAFLFALSLPVLTLIIAAGYYIRLDGNLHMGGYRAQRNDSPEYLSASNPYEPVKAQQVFDSLSKANPFIKELKFLGGISYFSVKVEDDLQRFSLPLQYFPLWEVEERETSQLLPVASDQNGTVSVSLPKGTHELWARLREPQTQTAASGISLSAFGMYVLTSVWAWRQKLKAKRL